MQLNVSVRPTNITLTLSRISITIFCWPSRAMDDFFSVSVVPMFQRERSAATANANQLIYFFNRNF